MVRAALRTRKHGKSCYTIADHMAEKKSGTTEPIREIEIRATEIPIARSRAVEPYIKTFSFRPENVTQEHLGTLVGVFSVFDRSESSAYTVNLITSVAKKEYYANPRRGAIESFESTLHRINLALAELVKNGQTEWMGSLHGAIAVAEKRNIHFSTTGDGAVILFRDGSLSDISEGLASEEAASHPLKTFLEISSGRLAPDDCLLLSTPELFELFSRRDLERNANRLLPEKKFTRFLETAMVNELRSGGAVVLSVSESRRAATAASGTKRAKKSEKPESVNAWSDKAFRQAAEERTKAIMDSYDPEEDVTPTMEHQAPVNQEIRIQGEALENADEHPMVTRFRWMIEDAVRSVRNTVTRSVQKTRKTGESAFESVSEAVSTSMNSRRNGPIAPRPEPESARTEDGIIMKRQPDTRPVGQISGKSGAEAGTTGKAAHVPNRHLTSARIRNRIRLPLPFREKTPRDISMTPTPRPEYLFLKRAGETYVVTVAFLSKTARTTKAMTVRYAVPATKKAYRFTRQITIRAAKWTAELGNAAWHHFLSLPQKRQIIIAAIAAFLATGLGIVVWKNIPEEQSETTPVMIVETPVIAQFPPTEETNASLASATAVPAADHDIVSPVYLGDSLFLATRNGVIDTTRNMTSSLPTTDAVRLAGGMEDLGLIFLLTEGGDLYSFAPGNRTFVKNAIPFPVGFKTAAMGDFLTYLYFLEEGTGRIYRFPRADGGFGDGILWTKSAMPADTDHIAVSENIFGAGSALTAFFRGNPVGDFSFRKPATPLSITSVCANSDVPDRIVVLDAPAKRVIVVNGKGEIVSQLFDESFDSATACALSGNGGAVTVSGGTSSSTITIPR